MEQHINLETINFNKLWKFPKPKAGYDTALDYSVFEGDCIKVNQQKFIDEYYVSGHQVHNPDVLRDYWIKKRGIDQLTGKETEYYEQINVERITLPIQQDSTDVLLAHMFGREIKHKDISFDKTEENQDLLKKFKEVWDSKNIDSVAKDFIKNAMICGEAALYFFINKDGEIQTQVLSLFKKDKLAVKTDCFGNVESLYRKYNFTNDLGEVEERIDHITIDGVGIYNDKGDKIDEIENKFPFLPIVYHYRDGGAWWSQVQPNIDELEKLLSLLAEDNKAKAKAKMHVATQKPNNVKTQTLAGADVIVTGVDGKVNLLQPAVLSDALKYIIEQLQGQIEKTLGVIYPELKSGDLPTGSMKLAFFPTERICKTFIDEFSPVIDKISKMFKRALIIEFNTFNTQQFKDMFIKSKIAIYSPQDSLATLTSTADAYAKGAMTESAVVMANPDYMDLEDINKLIEANKQEEQPQEDKPNAIGFQSNSLIQVED